MTNERESRLITWLAVEHGDRIVGHAFANGWFRDAIAIAAELHEADAKYFATSVLRTALAAGPAERHAFGSSGE